MWLVTGWRRVVEERDHRSRLGTQARRSFAFLVRLWASDTSSYLSLGEVVAGFSINVKEAQYQRTWRCQDKVWR